MKPIIEALEGRRLLAGHPGGPVAGCAIADRLLTLADGVNDPAVQADVALVQADKTAIAAASADVKDQSSDTRQALKDTLQSGFALLQADRQAIRDAQDDPTALAAAKDKRKADRDQLRTDAQTARDAVRSDAADAKTALQTALQSLKDHVAQLRTDLQNAGVDLPTRPSRPQPTTGGNQNTTDGNPVATPPAAGDGTATGGGASNAGGSTNQPPTTPPHVPVSSTANANLTVAPEEAAAVVDKVKQAAAGISGIDQAAVTNLTDHLTAAASDSSVTPDERQQIGEDLHTVVENLTPADAKSVAGPVVELLHLPPPPPPMNAPGEPGEPHSPPPSSVDISIPVSADQAQAVVDKIKSITASISSVSQDAVDKLTGDITAAASDGTVVLDELKQLHEDVKALVAGLTDADTRAIGEQVRSLLGEPPLPNPPPPPGNGGTVGIPLPADQAKSIVDEINAIAAGISGIDQMKVTALTDAITAAATDGQLSKEEVHGIVDDLKALVQGLDPAAGHGIAGALHEILPPPPTAGAGPGTQPPPPTTSTTNVPGESVSPPAGGGQVGSAGMRMR
jgi:hypothetical protein